MIKENAYTHRASDISEISKPRNSQMDIDYSALMIRDSNRELGFGTCHNLVDSKNTGCQNGTEDGLICSVILDHQYIEGS